MSPRSCVYTVLVGDYEHFQDQPAVAGSDVDRICFTDSPDLVSRTGWQVRRIQLRIPGDPARSSRWPKILPHLFLPEYDCSLYVDNSVHLTRDPAEIIRLLLPPNVDFAVLRHSFRESVAKEFEAVRAARLDSWWVIDEQLATYERLAPDVLVAPALWGGFLLRRHNSAAVVDAMQIWWEQVLRFSRRDQLALGYALHASGVAPLAHALDNHESWCHTWPHTTGRMGLHDRPPIEPDATIYRREAEIAQLKSELVRAREVSAARAQDIGSLALELAAIRAHDLSTTHRLEQVLESTSWRITEPLRRLRKPR